MIAGLILFLILPVAVGTLVYGFQRWGKVVAVLSIGVTTALGVAIMTLPLGQTVTIWGRQIVMGGSVSFLGRDLILEDTDRIAIAFLYLTAAVVFALAGQTSSRRLIFPVGFGMLSLLSGSLLIRPLIYGVLLLEMAIALSMLALHVEGAPPGQGVLQYVSFSLLAMPGLLFVQWLMDRYALTPDNVALRETAVALLAFSFALLMGIVPFHMWLPSMADDGDPFASAFVLTVNHGAIWFLLLAFLEAYPDLSAHARFGSLVSGAGLAMVGVGGVLGAAQQRLGRLMGYGALIDGGVTLVAFGVVSQRGLAISLLCLLVRPIGLALMASGLAGLRALGGRGGGIERLCGIARQAPWSTLAFAAGGVSLAGLPVSAGFAGRWALYRSLGAAQLTSALIMMGGSVGLMTGVWRSLSVLLATEDRPSEETEGADTAGERAWIKGIVVVLSVAASAILGLAPQLLAPTAARLASLYTFFAP